MIFSNTPFVCTSLVLKQTKFNTKPQKWQLTIRGFQFCSQQIAHSGPWCTLAHFDTHTHRHKRQPCNDISLWAIQGCHLNSNSSSWRIIQSAWFADHKDFYCLLCYSSSPCTELNVCLFACTLHVKLESAQAKLFSALYLRAHSMPQAWQSFPNSQCLVKVGIPEMWKSIMDDSSFGLSTRGEAW